MAKSIHVNGPALISIGQGGTGAGLVELGMSIDGVDIVFEHFFDEVFADSAGPSVPIDEQDMGKVAFISAQLQVYDADILESLMAMGATANNRETSPGRLLGANDLYNRVVVASPTELRPWRFYWCRLFGQTSQKIGTKRTIPNVRFRALPNVGSANTMGGITWWDHTGT